ncbi:MAG: hypothetical protein JJU45_19120 [Acidimicrobiia bacterium]|nr:hypothetical protein [Acidimicrobiia bacterium]
MKSTAQTASRGVSTCCAKFQLVAQSCNPPFDDAAPTALPQRQGVRLGTGGYRQAVTRGKTPDTYLTQKGTFGNPERRGAEWTTSHDVQGRGLMQAIWQHLVATKIKNALRSHPDIQTQAALARITPYSKPLWSKYLSGKAVMPEEAAFAAGKALECKVLPTDEELNNLVSDVHAATGVFPIEWVRQLPPTDPPLQALTVAAVLTGTVRNVDGYPLDEIMATAEQPLRTALFAEQATIRPGLTNRPDPNIRYWLPGEDPYDADNIYNRSSGVVTEAEGVEIDADVYLDTAWLEATRRWPAVLVDGRFPIAYLEWDDHDRPTTIAAIRALPRIVFPDGTGDDWTFATAPASVHWDGDTATLEWHEPDLIEAADAWGERVGRPPIRNIHLWAGT